MREMNFDRLMRNLASFEATSATPGRGVTRLSWSNEFFQARLLLQELCLEAGLHISHDPMGNLRASLPAESEEPAICLGSHLDTVFQGGPLDGIYGVCAALESIWSIAESGVSLKRPLRLVAFVEEEGSNYGCTCLGSKMVTGQHEPEFLQSLYLNGESLWQRLRDMGQNPEALPAWQFDSANTLCFLEAHIEQNARLESTNTAIGIVTNILGMRLCEISFQGISDHAATPMEKRRDPVIAFADFIRQLRHLKENGGFDPDVAWTIGRIDCQPNVPIASARELVFTLDLRHPDSEYLDQALENARELAQRTAMKHGLSFSFRCLSASGGVRLNAGLRALLSACAANEGLSHMDLPSWPAHDAACMAKIVPTAMLFVPSREGRSHCPEEFTESADLAAGALVLEKATLLLASGEDWNLSDEQ